MSVAACAGVNPALLVRCERALQAPLADISRLSSLTNENYLLCSSNGRRAVLRVNNPHAVELGIDRQLEAQIVANACVAGLHPPLYWLDADSQLSCYVDASAEPLNIDELAGLLRRVHGLAPQGKAINYFQRIGQLLGSGFADVAFVREMEHLQQCLQTTAKPLPVLCHHDLLAANILSDAERHYVIDWEYAAVGDAHVDLATIARDRQLPNRDIQRLCNAYSHAAISSERVHLCIELVASLERAWRWARD